MQEALATAVTGISPRKVLVINLYYSPDLASTGQLAADICEELVEQGLEVHVVAAQPCYTAGQPEVPEFEVRNGVHVHRIPVGKTRGRERMMTRLAGYLRFLLGGAHRAAILAARERPAHILTFHNPPLVGMIGAWLARRHRIAFTYALYDIHPDVLVATGWGRLPPPLLRLWDLVNRWILSHATDIVVLGEGMKRTLVETGRAAASRVHVIPTWAKPELPPAVRDARIRAEFGVSDGDLLLLYSGNMGIMHAPDPILEAAARVKDIPVRFLFIGDGARRRHLVDRVRREGLDRVTFLPLQPEARFIDIIGASDACFVALRPGLERLAVPCRAYTLLSAGRPLITIMNPQADIARLVAETGCGWNVENAADLSELIRALWRDPERIRAAGRNGRRVYGERFRREALLGSYVRILGQTLPMTESMSR